MREMPTNCYSINLLVSASGWHPRVTATVSLLTYDFLFLTLMQSQMICNHSADCTAFLSHRSHVCIVYKTDIDWAVSPVN